MDCCSGFSSRLDFGILSTISSSGITFCGRCGFWGFGDSTGSASARRMTTRAAVDDDDDFVDEIPIIKTTKLMKTTAGRVYKRMCDEGLLVGKTGVKVTCFCNVWVGANIVEGVVSDTDLLELKKSAFGDFFNLGGIKWLTGQLMTLLALNYVQPMKRTGDMDRLKFHIGDRVEEFKKSDFALITGMKFGKKTEFVGIDMDEPNDISMRYFGGKMSVTRQDVEHVFKNVRGIRGKKPMDVLKLALLYLVCCHVVGNQGRTRIPALYMHLVNDLELFNDFEWGEHLWKDVVESMGKCSSILNTGGNGRFTFPGFLFPLQIWSFETFPRLMENGICAIGKGSGSLCPRALRWETGVRPKHDVLENSIFGKPGESVNWKEMVATPMERGMGNFERLLSVGGAGNGSSSNACGEAVNEEYGAGHRSLKGKFHWGHVTACADGVQNEDEMQNPTVVEDVLGEGRGENEPALRDVLTAIVHMEKRNSKLRVEVTKLRIALNAQSRLLKRVLLGRKMAKRQQKKRGDKREENGMPSFDLGIESQERRDDPGNGQEDMIWEEDIIRDADIGTQLGVSDNDVEDLLNDVNTQEVDGRWRKAVEGLGLKLDSGKGAECSKLMNLANEKTTDDVHRDERVVEEQANVVQRMDDAELVRPSISKDVCAGGSGSGNGTVIGEVAGGFRDKFETASQIIEAQEVTPEKICYENVREVDEEIVCDGPKLMDKLGVYEGREEGPIGDSVLAIEGGSCCPQQNDGSSCGMFVVKIAEFLMMGHDVQDMNDTEIAAYRKKMTTELLAYSAL
ncbi:unnamed protein product [Cuscuta campestris]|uniref:DUF1985 domain-containing protein n=1 Tax=Cuscuta campestris TaxID=132261 RepID=A0A484KBG9_9ASTE|nr:unnamed protein product [Cuscuta campestris]